MDARAFRHLYAYHFSENHAILRDAAALTAEQWTQPPAYSIGAVRDQIVHLMWVDDTWFSGLHGAPLPDPFAPADFPDVAAVRAKWEIIERQQHDFLAALRDEMLWQKPFADGEDKDLITWQVLLQVLNHGTDHRAQILRQLHDFGVKTVSQDYIFFAYENPVPQS